VASAAMGIIVPIRAMRLVMWKKFRKAEEWAARLRMDRSRAAQGMLLLCDSHAGWTAGAITRIECAMKSEF
jgi:hypothetical protein